METTQLQTTNQVKASLLHKIHERTAKVAVVGMGYVGMPFAVEKAKVGYSVTGIEQNPRRAEKINRGDSYIDDVSSDEFRSLVQKGLIKAETNFSKIAEMDIIIICVPTPLTKNLTPDLSYVENVTFEIAQHIRPGQFISLESTTYPGTTEEVMLPILQKSGLRVEKDFYLTHSPERVDPGNKRYTTHNTNKVIGGVGPESLEVGMAFYSKAIENLVPVSSAKAAELVKVFENTYRAVNIALVNELMLLCDRIDLSVWEVLDAAFTKPFGIMPFYPGPGVGGHCIPLDPHYLEWKAKEVNFNTHFISLAGEINRKMPEFVIEKARRVLNQLGLAPSKAKVLVLGAAYKKDIGDWRESPAVEIMKLLEKERVQYDYHDPYVDEFEEHGLKKTSVPLTPDALKTADLVILATDHSNFDHEFIAANSRAILDTRNSFKKVKNHREKITLL